jgi:indolepyruvate ferredoxin oxidoreductase beta subunit
MDVTALPSDPFNIIITGVGGQGNVLASRVLANMLVGRGYRITIGETFGMSQRGGSVMSHIRVSPSGEWSPQIPEGQAHFIIALEPVEALRVVKRFGNPAVMVLSNNRPIYPVGVITGELSYPSPEALADSLRRLSREALLIDATAGALKLGQPILGNIIMIGAAVAMAVLPLSRADFETVIARSVRADQVAINLAAFDLGAALPTSSAADCGSGDGAVRGPV